MKNFYYLKNFPDLSTEIPKNCYNVSSLVVGNYNHPFVKFSSWLSPSLENFFKSNDLLEKNETIRCNWFRLRPQSIGPIHLDGVRLMIDTWAINWFINWQNTFMEWFEPLVEGNSYKTFNSTGGITWNDSDVKLIEQVELNRPCFVNISLPHRMNSKSDKWRFCLSARITIDRKGTLVFLDKEEMFRRLVDKNLLEL